jgi:hypothetical protein
MENVEQMLDTCVFGDYRRMVWYRIRPRHARKYVSEDDSFEGSAKTQFGSIGSNEAGVVEKAVRRNDRRVGITVDENPALLILG